jgi:pimeloyl-ACP methyl ester carboxylesterase
VIEPETQVVNINGHPCRIWRKGVGPKIGFIAGVGGLSKWTPFLEKLAEHRTVIVPSLPGFPGGARGHIVLDSLFDWVLTFRQLIVASDLIGCDLVGSSIGGALAAEFAATWQQDVRKLVLISPFGMFDEANPAADIWAQTPDGLAALLCEDSQKYKDFKAPPEGVDAIEWSIEQTRANEAGARIFWPLGDTGLSKRLELITTATLLLWGEKDRVMPRDYADKFAKLISGKTEIKLISEAGHLAEFDEPDQVVNAILQWTN